MLINYYSVHYYDVYKLNFVVKNMFETIKNLINFYGVCLIGQSEITTITLEEEGLNSVFIKDNKFF